MPNIQKRVQQLLLVCTSVLVIGFLGVKVRADADDTNPAVVNATNLVLQGQRIFRFDTFGNQAFWGDMLKLHLVIEGNQFGGMGAGLSPNAALTAGLKVDVEAF